MGLVPNSVLLHGVARERQARLLAAAPARRQSSQSLPLRVRVGRVVMSAGALISGDCIEPVLRTNRRRLADARRNGVQQPA